jgi:hypothetical protein
MNHRQFGGTDILVGDRARDSAADSSPSVLINMRRRSNILRAISRVAHLESGFLEQEFLAPVVRGRKVAVRIGGVVCTMQIAPRGFEGWGAFAPMSHREARLVREATLAQRRQYLELFPRVRLIVTWRGNRHLMAIGANPGGDPVPAAGVRVELVDEAHRFDTIVARFDGSTYWFDQFDETVDARAAAHLRACLVDMTEPGEIARPGLTLGQRAAYSIAYVARLKELPEYQDENRLRAALQHAGASLREFAQQGDFFRVAFDLDGERHISMVDARDLTVQSAGICLSGRDRDFDLASLMGVLREGRDQWDF